MCARVWDTASDREATTPREFAAIFGRDSIVWHSFYTEDGSAPEWDEFADCCLCPVNVFASAKQAGKAVSEDDGFWLRIS